MPPAAAVPVQLARLQTANLRDSSEFIGRLDAQAGVVLQPETTGRITRIFVNPGDRVQAGAPIVQLSPDRSQSEYNAALAGVSVARSARDNAQAQLRATEAQRGRLAAEVDLQNTEYARTQALVNQGALSQQQLDRVSRDRNAAIAALKAADEDIAAARASLQQTAASLAESEASANATQVNLQDTTITAPIAGIVGDFSVKLGDYVGPGTTLSTITQNDSLELVIAVPIEQARRLQLGMPVELLSFGGDRLTTGSISFVSPQTDTNTQTVLARARFTQAEARLQDDQRVEVRVIWDEQPGLLAPATAITRLGGQPFVYVAEPSPDDPSAEQQIARLQPVTLGAMQGNDYQVLEGLSAGQRIVVSGLLSLRDGASIVQQVEASE
jgi:RND family efflux transporter MFP subunit